MKRNVLVILSAVLVFAMMATAICIGEEKAEEKKRIDRAELVLERTAELSGYESLGIVDAYAISKKNGKVYDGPAVRAALFERAGLETPDNCWVYTFDTFDGVMLLKLVVYKGEPKQPIMEQEVERTYLYGVL